MEWEDKVKMIQLGNKRSESEESKKEFQSFVLEHLNTFDKQSWDMFVQSVDLIPDQMRSDLEFWELIYQKIKDVDCNDDAFDWRAGMRIALIQTICEDEFLFT